jgi:hypothetical protein
MNQYEICKVGDNVQFETFVPIKEGYNYQFGKQYKGVITSQEEGVKTSIEIIGDNGAIVAVNIYYDCFSNGMSGFKLLISEEEHLIREKEWLVNVLEYEATKYQERIEYLSTVAFKR